jgi:hypothetical protein
MEKPTVIIPYPGPSTDIRSRDIFVYLRPETNGVLTESALFQVLAKSPIYRDHMELVYLANIPGEFILQNKIIEEHYCYKMPFARMGGLFFTDYMLKGFEQYFRRPFSESRILGAFDALKELDMTEEELFDFWVTDKDIMTINCQTIKRINDVFVVNYDIPALLHKNTNSTDIAVMLFRNSLTTDEFHHMIEDMRTSLREKAVLGRGRALRRALHYSRGPFEQVLDARGHLYTPEGKHITLEEMQFCSFMRRKGIFCEEIGKILDHPIMGFRTETGEIREECLFFHTEDATYEEAYEILTSTVSQYIRRYPAQ